MWRQLASSHMVPRTEMAFVLTYMDPRGEVEKTHLHLASFSPSSEVTKNRSVVGGASEWSNPRNLRSIKSSGTIQAMVLHFPMPGSASQASL
uniref:Uncharacterized protein n=1 Tax=Colobus angolensis palliatus TaxID=336983 RepID=A0A2K5K370_COLAP